MSDSLAAPRFVRQMAQILSVEKLTVGFMIGAGCPVSVKVPIFTDESSEPVSGPLIPDVSGLTKLVLAELGANTELSKPVERLLSLISDDGTPSPNIEFILGFVRTLAAAAGSGDVRGLASAELRDIDEEICASISDKVNKSLPSSDSAYNHLARFIAPRRLNAVEIFTTNYDLLMEQALEAASVPYFDGFIGSRQPFFDLAAIEQDALPPRWARLWKLHGSVNWRQHQDTRKVCRTLDADAGSELLIHPSHRKYDDSRRMPYLALIDRLRSFLRNNGQPVALLVHGFSFSDEHLNAVLEEGLRANSQAACFAFQYSNIDDYPGGIKLAGRRPNFNLVGRDAQLSRGIRTPWRVGQSSTNAQLSDVFSWDASTFEGQDASTDAEFVLGDFGKFGRFLASLIGEELDSAEVAP